MGETRKAGEPCAVVLNPQAGRGLAGRVWPRLEGLLTARGVAHQKIMSDSAAAALERLAGLPPDRPLVAVGGDGTVHGLLPAVVGTNRPLAIVPLGSGNDFAALLGLRTGDLAAALDRLALAPCPCDALEVRLEGRRELVLNGLGMGFDAQVADLMRRAPQYLSGFGRYLWAALRGVQGLQLGEVEVVVDGEPVYHGPSCLVAVMNGRRYGGGFCIAPDADPRDGLLDVVLGTRVSRLGLLRLLVQVLRGDHLNDPRVRCARGREVWVRWQTPTHLHLDGELSGQTREVQVCVQPGAVLLHG